MLHPERTVSDMFAFLGVGQVPGITEACFSVGHEAGGPGDEKIWLTSGIHARSVGSGLDVPVFAIPDRLRERLNELLHALGYGEVGEDWSSAGQILPGGTRPDPGGEASLPLPAVTPARIAEALDRWPQLAGKTVGIVIRAGDTLTRASWLLDPGQPGTAGQPDVAIAGELSAWKPVLAGEENLASACLNHKLRVRHLRPERNWSVLPDEAHALAHLLGLATARQSLAPLALAAAQSRSAATGKPIA